MQSTDVSDVGDHEYLGKVIHIAFILVELHLGNLVELHSCVTCVLNLSNYYY